MQECGDYCMQIGLVRFPIGRVGSFRVLTNDTLFVDLLKGCGAVLCRVEVDCQSRVANPSAGRVLSRLLNSLPAPGGK